MLAIPNENSVKHKNITLLKNPKLLNFQNQFSNLQIESNELQQLQFLQNQINQHQINQTNLSTSSLNNKKNQLNDKHKQLLKIEQETKTLKSELQKLEEQTNKLQTTYHKETNQNKELTKKLINLRKDNLIMFFNQLSQNEKYNYNCNFLKKEICLLSNILKYRIVNVDSDDNDNLINGYMVDVERNSIEVFNSSKNKDNDNNSTNFWKKMRMFLNHSPYSSVHSNDKENDKNVMNN